MVIQHEDEDPIGVVGARLRELGFDLDIRRGHEGDLVPATIDRAHHCGLVVLGGYMGADDDAEFTWLRETKRLLAWSVATQSVPTLGICLGHQLLARALHGSVGRNPSGRALGPKAVQLTREGHNDPLLTGTHGQLALHYNDDVVLKPPAGAVVLARTADGAAQAIRYGLRSWGVQFHPEVEPSTFATWSDIPQATLTQASAAGPALLQTWRAFTDRFAALLQ